MSGIRITQSNPLLYHTLLVPVLGSVTSTLLLSQIVYWHEKMGGHFYKYRMQCADSKPGDSWCEELAFSPDEFDGALKRISTKLKKGVTIENVFAVNTLPFAEVDEEIPHYIKRVQKDGYLRHLVAYWSTYSRQTYYALNQPLYNVCFAIAYPRETLNWQSLNQLIYDVTTETTTETTTEITKVFSPSDLAEETSASGTLPDKGRAKRHIECPPEVEPYVAIICKRFFGGAAWEKLIASDRKLIIQIVNELREIYSVDEIQYVINVWLPKQGDWTKSATVRVLTSGNGHIAKALAERENKGKPKYKPVEFKMSDYDARPTARPTYEPNEWKEVQS